MLNVRGLGVRRKQCQPRRLSHEKDLEILVVQGNVGSESATDAMVEQFKSRYDVYVIHAVRSSAGCILLILNCLGTTEQSVVSCTRGRFDLRDFIYGEANMRIIFVYASTTPCESLVFQKLCAYIGCNKFIILLGDFNCVFSADDPIETAVQESGSAVSLKRNIEKYSLQDAAQFSKRGMTRYYTHFQGRSHARLDGAHVSLELGAICNNYAVEQVTFSGNSCVIFTIGNKLISQPKFGWDLWKLNAKLLKNDSFLAGTKQRFEEMWLSGAKSRVQKLEQCKVYVKIRAIERSVEIRHAEQAEQKNPKQMLKELIVEENRTPGLYGDLINEVKAKLEAIDVAKFQGAAIRARTDRLLSDDMPSRRNLTTKKKKRKRERYRRNREQRLSYG